MKLVYVFAALLIAGCSAPMLPPEDLPDAALPSGDQDADEADSVSEDTNNETCASYTRFGEQITACATCGDGICEEYETCTASTIGGSQDRPVSTRDCGGLYCPEDCEQQTNQG